MNLSIDSKKAIHDIMRKKPNSYCADCFDACALYVDMKNKIFLCQNCALIHQQFGFDVKNVATDDFSTEEIESLKMSNNQTFNNQWMALYNYDSQRIPFGANVTERRSFLQDKYITKQWFSPFFSKNFNFDRKNFQIEEYSDSFEQQSPFASSSDQSDFSDVSSPNDLCFLEIEAPSVQQVADFSLVDSNEDDLFDADQFLPFPLAPSHSSSSDSMSDKQNQYQQTSYDSQSLSNARQLFTNQSVQQPQIYNFSQQQPQQPQGNYYAFNQQQPQSNFYRSNQQQQSNFNAFNQQQKQKQQSNFYRSNQLKQQSNFNALNQQQPQHLQSFVRMQGYQQQPEQRIKQHMERKQTMQPVVQQSQSRYNNAQILQSISQIAPQQGIQQQPFIQNSYPLQEVNQNPFGAEQNQNSKSNPFKKQK